MKINKKSVEINKKADELVKKLVTLTNDKDQREEAEKLHKELSTISPKELLRQFTM